MGDFGLPVTPGIAAAAADKIIRRIHIKATAAINDAIRPVI